jgi:hypothetical protein
MPLTEMSLTWYRTKKATVPSEYRETKIERQLEVKHVNAD